MVRESFTSLIWWDKDVLRPNVSFQSHWLPGGTYLMWRLQVLCSSYVRLIRSFCVMTVLCRLRMAWSPACTITTVNTRHHHHHHHHHEETHLDPANFKVSLAGDGAGQNSLLAQFDRHVLHFSLKPGLSGLSQTSYNKGLQAVG